jgi:hypothetical protein
MQVTAYNFQVMNTIYGLDDYRGMSNMLEGLPHAQSLSPYTACLPALKYAPKAPSPQHHLW